MADGFGFGYYGMFHVSKTSKIHTRHLISDQASQQQSQFHAETGDMAQQFRHGDDDDNDNDDNFADPGSHYDIDRILHWQSRHDNEQDDPGLSDDESRGRQSRRRCISNGA